MQFKEYKINFTYKIGIALSITRLGYRLENRRIEIRFPGRDKIHSPFRRRCIIVIACNYASEYAIIKVQGNQMGLK
jgi:hypothetical protein